MNKLTKKDLGIGIGVFSIVFILMYCFCGFLKNGISTPFSYSGWDDFQWYLQVKSIGDNGWFWHNDFVGAPYGQDLYDFVGFFHMNFESLLSKLIYFFSHDPAITLNILLLLCFALSSFVAFFSLRMLEIRRIGSIYGAIIYGIAPYIQARGLDHFSLSVAYFVPLSILLCVWCYKSDDEYLRLDKNFFKHTRNILSLIFIVLIANNGWGYYAIFTCFFLCITALFNAINNKRIYRVLSELKLIIAIFIFFCINMIPVIMYQLRNGNNLSIAQRHASDGEIYGLKIAYFFINNINTHGIKLLENLKNTYYTSMPLVNENHTGYLGLIGIIGFVMALYYVLVANKTKDNKFNATCMLLSRLTIFAILFATIGGFSGIIAIYFHAIRGYNRISIFITFICIAITIMVFENIIDIYMKKKAYKIFICLNVIIFAFGILDQLPRWGAYDEKLKNNQIAYDSDAKFIDEIEKLMNDGDMIYQLPYQKFPENGAINQMYDYQLYTGYIHSSTLKWSYGGMKGRNSDKWNEYVSNLEMNQRINTLCSSGFKGIYIDKRAYTEDELEILLDDIESVISTSCIISGNENLIFYNLYPYIEANLELLEEEPLTIEQIEYPLIEIGRRYSFTTKDNSGQIFLAAGFSATEDLFTWTDGKQAVLKMTIDNNVPKLQCSIAINGIYNGEQDISIKINGIEVYSRVLNGKCSIDFAFPNDSEKRTYEITIDIPNAISPLNVGESGDGRNLGLMFESICMTMVE